MERCAQDYPVTQFTEAIQKSFDAALKSRFENTTQDTSRYKWEEPKMKIWREDWPSKFPRTHKAGFMVSVFRHFIRQVTTVRVRRNYDCHETKQGKYSLSTVYDGCEKRECAQVASTVYPFETRQKPWWKCICECPDFEIENVSSPEYVPIVPLTEENSKMFDFAVPLSDKNVADGSKSVVELTFEVHVSSDEDAQTVAESIRQFNRNSTAWGPTVTEEFTQQLIRDCYDQPKGLRVRLVGQPVIGDIAEPVSGATPSSASVVPGLGLMLLVSAQIAFVKGR
jgi:hypothetical protein